MKMVTAFVGIDQGEIHSIVPMIRGGSPPECIVGHIGVAVFRNGDIADGVDEAMRLDESIALKKRSLEIGLESPEDLNAGGDQVYQLERLATSLLRCDPIDDPFLFIELLRRWLDRDRYDVP